MARRSALERRPGRGGGRGEDMVRVSPGVYRSATGALQRSARRPGRPGDMRPRQPQPFGGDIGALTDAMNKGPAQWGGGANVDPGRYGRRAIDQLYGSMAEGAGEALADQVRDYTPNIEAGEMPRWPMGGRGFEDVYQPSRNMGGRYRLSPGVYGSREQAMRQFEQQAGPGQIGRNAGQMVQYPAQMAEGMARGIGQAFGNEVDTAQDIGRELADNNLMRGNPIKRPGNLAGAAVGGMRRRLRW